MINKVESTECINGRVDNDLIDLLESAVNHIVDLESELDNLKQKNLLDVLSESDIISIHLPLNDDTENIINAQAFEPVC